MTCTIEELQALIDTENRINYSLEDLTQETLEGAGVFDVLMRALENHLEREHENDRITGDQYASTYVQLTNVVLQQSISFILGLGKLQLDKDLNALQQAKLMKEIQLLCQKLVTEKAQVLDRTVLDPTAADEATYLNDNGELFNQTVQPVEGTIGRRNSVLVRQKQGYDDDYKTKSASTILDTYRTLAANQIPTTVPSILDPGIDYIMKVMKMDSGLQEWDNTDYLGDERADESGKGQNAYWKMDIPDPDAE